MSFPPPPAAGETHVWIVGTDLLEPHGRPLRALAGDDSPRALGRGFLRVLLGTYLDVPPPEVPLERRCPACGGGHGPPVADDLNVSVSYTSGWVAYAIAPAPVGIDIEVGRPGFAWRRAASSVLSSAEIEELERQPLSQRTAAFSRAWVSREAVGKATGVGLISPPPEVHPPLAIRMVGAGQAYAAAVAARPGRILVREAKAPSALAVTRSAPDSGLGVALSVHVAASASARGCRA